MKYGAKKFKKYPEIMDKELMQIACQISKRKALALLQKYIIPKCYLIDWLCSDDCNNTNHKSLWHIDILWEVQKRSDEQ